MSLNPKITILLPCYNSMKYLEECITSVLNQDYKDYVVWACDNESTDGTYEYLLGLEKKHEKLKVFQLPNIYPNGYGEAVEYAIKNIKSDYVTFIASDDYIESNYISNCMKIFSHDPDKIKCIQSAIRGISEGQIVNHQVHSYKSLEEFKKQCLERSPVNTPTVVCHKSVLPFLRVYEAHHAAGYTCAGACDYDTYCCMADKGIFIYPVPIYLGYNYRWHENQCTWKVIEIKKEIDYDNIIQEYWRKKWKI